MLHHTQLRFKEALASRAKDCTRYIIIHHTEVTGTHTVEEIHQWHLNRGMAGIGYHYYIRKNGEIYEGRPYHTVGAHAYDKEKNYGFNPVSVGVCFDGDFNKEIMEEKQLDASVMLISILSLAYGNIPLHRHGHLIIGRSCPGKNFPFEELCEKVEICKSRLRALFGEDSSKFDYMNLLEQLTKIRN